MREGSPEKLLLSQTVSGFQFEAKSLFRKILALNPYGSRFCPDLSIPNRAKFIETNILAEGHQKKMRYRYRRQESFRSHGTFRRPSGAHFQLDGTLPGAGSAGLFSSAPTGLAKNSGSGPTALSRGLYSFAASRLTRGMSNVRSSGIPSEREPNLGIAEFPGHIRAVLIRLWNAKSRH